MYTSSGCACLLWTHLRIFWKVQAISGKGRCHLELYSVVSFVWVHKAQYSLSSSLSTTSFLTFINKAQNNDMSLLFPQARSLFPEFRTAFRVLDEVHPALASSIGHLRSRGPAIDGKPLSHATMLD